MKKFFLRNSSEGDLWVIVEPVADRYVIVSGAAIIIEYEVDGGEMIEVEYYSSNEVAVWTHGPTRAYADGKLLVAE